MTCERCNGTGKVSYRTSGGDSVTLSDGTTITDMGGHYTRACACVRDLPAIDGKATWWETEVIHSEVVGVPIGNEAIELTADCEVPRDGQGRRVHRTFDNAYYPPLIRIEAPPHGATLFADDARKLSKALLAAAAACDKADELAQQTWEAGR